MLLSRTLGSAACRLLIKSPTLSFGSSIRAFARNAKQNSQPVSLKELLSQREAPRQPTMAAVSQAQVKAELAEVLAAADWETASERSIREAVAAKLGEGVNQHKAFIKEAVAEHLEQAAGSAAQPKRKAEAPPDEKREAKAPRSAAAGDVDVSQGIDLGSKKRAEVSVFKGKKLVNLREFYEKDGKLLPGKKGISLQPEQFAKVVDKLDEVQAALDSEDTDFEVMMSDKRKLTISKYSGQAAVDLREWYEKDGELKPGQKGVQLRKPAWEKLSESAAALLAEASK